MSNKIISSKDMDKIIQCFNIDLYEEEDIDEDLNNLQSNPYPEVLYSLYEKYNTKFSNMVLFQLELVMDRYV